MSILVPNSAPVAQPQQPAKQPPKNRRPEELDALAAQLNDLGAPSNPPGVEDDDSDEDSAAPPASDGTLLASEPPKPLLVAHLYYIITCNSAKTKRIKKNLWKKYCKKKRIETFEYCYCFYICRPAGKYGRDTLEALENIVSEGKSIFLETNSIRELPGKQSFQINSQH